MKEMCVRARMQILISALNNIPVNPSVRQDYTGVYTGGDAFPAVRTFRSLWTIEHGQEQFATSR